MTTQSVTRGRLTSEQVEQYRRNGYLIVNQPVFPAERFERLRRHFEEKLAGLDPEVRPEAMDVPHFEDCALFEWLFDDAVLDLVEPIVGPDIALFSSHFICKPGGHGKRVPWHEDSAYWKGTLDPMEVVTVWLAIDPSSEENGCMRVIPRSHGNGYSEYVPVDTQRHVFPTEVRGDQFDASQAVAIELEANRCSLHDARIIHGSEANVSGKRRCGYTMRFMSAAVRFNYEKSGGWHQIYLARGRDRAGNVYADPTVSYPEKARFRTRHGKNSH